MIKSADQLIKEFENSWPSFHDANLSVVTRTEKNIVLRFSGGFLFDKVVEVTAKDICYEEYDES